MSEQAEPLDVKEIAKLRSWLSTRPDGKEIRYFNRLLATLDAVMKERDEWKSVAGRLAARAGIELDD